MAACNFNGNTDMYGLGIRLGFYLQWFSSVLGRFLVPKTYRDHRVDHPLKDEIKGLRFSNGIFSAATFLALLILVVENVSSLHVVEVYIVLLLTFGYSLTLVPIYLWRIVILCSPRWDPTRWPMSRPSRLESNLTFLLISGVASFQLWFWFSRIPQLDNVTCPQFGFLMTKVRLNLPAMQVINILLYVFVLFSCLIMLLASILKRQSKKRKRRTGVRFILLLLEILNIHLLMAFHSDKEARRSLLQNLSNVMALTVEGVVVTATELTIKWNNIQGVNTLASAGQTIPFAIGVVSFLRIIYVWIFKDPDARTDSTRDGSPEQPLSPTIFPPAAFAPPRPEEPMSSTNVPLQMSRSRT